MMKNLSRLSLIAACGYGLLVPIAVLTLFIVNMGAAYHEEYFLIPTLVYVITGCVSTVLFFSLLLKTHAWSKMKWPLRLIAYSVALQLLFVVMLAVDSWCPVHIPDGALRSVLEFIVILLFLTWLLSPIFMLIGFIKFGSCLQDGRAVRILSIVKPISQMLLLGSFMLAIVNIEGDHIVFMVLWLIFMLIFFIVSPLFYFYFYRYLKSKGDDLLKSLAEPNL
jgi:hypothetical protein